MQLDLLELITNKKILALFAIILIIILFLFLNQGPLVIDTQYFQNQELQITKTISFVANQRNETYEINLKNPITGFLIIPNTILTNNSQTSISGDFKTTPTQNQQITKIESKEYFPGNKKLNITTNMGEKEHTSILIAIPLKEYNDFSEIEKQELEELIKQISELEEEYFTIEETKKIMQEYYTQNANLEEIRTEQKLSFSNNNQTSTHNQKTNNTQISNNNQKIRFSGTNDYTTILQQILNLRKTQEPKQTIEEVVTTLKESEYFQNLSNSLNTIITNRQTINQDQEESQTLITITFKPEVTKTANKIIIPYSKENPIVIWNGEMTINNPNQTELTLQTNSNAITFEYTKIEQENQTTNNYLISIKVETQKLGEQITTINAIIQTNEFIPVQTPIEIILIENPCEQRINQYTEFENDYHAKYIKQVELYNASECFTNIATINLQTLEKPDQNQVGRETQISSQLITELTLDEKDKKQLIEQQSKKIEKYFTEFKQAQQKLEETFLETIISSKTKIKTSEEYIKLIEDKNAVNELNLKNIYAKLILEEKNLILDPTNYEAFKRKTELEIEFYLKSNQIDLNDNTKKEEIELLRESIYANNYAKHGAWDSETIYLELSLAKYNLENELYNAMEDLAKKMELGYNGINTTGKFKKEIFDPYSKNFNEKKTYSKLREAILYIGLSKELISEKQALEKIKEVYNQKDFDLYSIPFILQTKSTNITGYDLERNRINELFKEYLGLKLVIKLAYDVNTIDTKIKSQIANGEGTNLTDINYYPKGLEYNVIDGNKTLQQIFLADETKIGEWIYGTNYNAMLHLADGQQAKKYLTATYFGSINTKLKTIEHFKFREFIEDISQADQLAAQQAMFDNIASFEYQKVIELKEKEEKLTSWNYFLTNLFELRTVGEVQSEINFKIEALKGINQIQQLLLEGYNLQQIEQENTEWEQKPYFDSQENQIDYQRIYDLAKTQGVQAAKTEISRQNSDFIPFTEGQIEFLNKKTDNIYLALLITPVRNEFVKTYKLESVKVLNKDKIEQAETLEEAEQIIFPDHYKAEMLLKNADYYYNESMYFNAYQIYEDIKLFYPTTNSAVKANEQLKKFTTWKMYFAKPYWETYGKIGAEFLTAKELAKYAAFGATIRYVIIPQITKINAINQIQNVAKTQIQKSYALKVNPKTNLLMTRTQSKVTAILKTVEPVTSKIHQLGLILSKVPKKISNSLVGRMLKFDLTGGNASYTQWLKDIAQKAAIKEYHIINNQLTTLSKLSNTPMSQMNSTQLTQLKTTLTKLGEHKVVTTSRLETYLPELDKKIKNALYTEDLLKGTTPGPSVNATTITENTSLILNNSTQILPISLAKMTSATSQGLVSTPALNVLRQGEQTRKIVELNFLDQLKETKLKEEITTLQNGLTKAKTSKGYVADSFIKYLEERISTAQIELTNLSNGLDKIDDIKIACSLCTFKVKTKTSTQEFQVVGETQLTPTQTLQVNPLLPLSLNDVSIKGVELAKIIPEQVIVPSLENATLSMTKVAPDTILLKILTPKEIQIITPLNSSFEIIPNTKPIEETTSLIKTPIKIRGGLQWNTDDFLKRNPNYFENRQGLTSGTNFEVNSSPGEVHSIRGERTPLLTHDSLGSPMYLKKLTLEIDPTTINPDTEIIVKRIPAKNSYISKTIQVSYSLTGPNQITIYVTQPEYAQIEVIGEATLLDQGLNKLQSFFESKIKPLFEIKGNIEIIPNTNCENGCSITLTSGQTITQAEEGVLAQTNVAQALEKVDFKRVESIILPIKLPTNPNLTQDKILEFKEIATNLANDPTSILFEEQYLPVKGAVVDKKLFIEQVSREFEFNPYLAETFNGTEVFHGTTSETLYNLINQGGIKPFGELEANGYIPFIGTHDIGSAIGINRTAVSTTLITNYGGAARYAGEKEILITRELIQKNINYLTNELNQLTSESSGSMAEIEFKHNLNIANQRLARFDSLTEAEKEFFEVQFPILFGIKSARPNSYLFVNSDISHEIGLKSGANLDEIRVIYVPENRITQVETYLSKNTSTKHIKVASLERLTGRTITPLGNNSPPLSTINQVFKKILNFTCHSPCVWDNSSAVKIIENPFDNIEIKGDFSQIKKTQIKEYIPIEVAEQGIAQALKGAPNLAPTQIAQIETAMVEGKTIATIQQGINGQKIIVYTPKTSALNTINNPLLNEGTQTILHEPVVNGDLVAAINKLGIKKGDVIILESDSYDIFSPITSFMSNPPANYNVRNEVVFEGFEGDRIRVKRNGMTVNIPSHQINRISAVNGNLQIGLTEVGKQKLVELKNRLKLDTTTSFPIDFDLARDFPSETVFYSIYKDKKRFLEAVDFFEQEIRKEFVKNTYNYQDSLKDVDEALTIIKEFGFEKFRLKSTDLTEKETNATILFNVAKHNGDQETFARKLLADGINEDTMNEIITDTAEQIWRNRVGITKNTPPYVNLSYLRDAKQEFFVHFTSENNLDTIATQGFNIGVTQLNGIQQTIGSGAAYEITGKEPGYNFACVPGEYMSYPQNNPTKGMIVIKADAVIVYHNGDREPQAIFWGQDVPIGEIVPLKLFTQETQITPDSYTKEYTWMFDLPNGSSVDISSGTDKQKTIDEVIDWVRKHWDDFKEIRRLNNGTLKVDYVNDLPETSIRAVNKIQEKWETQGLPSKN